MDLGRHQVLAQLETGPDGSAYRARDAENQHDVLLRVLNGAFTSEQRWQPLTRRLRLAALLDHPAAAAIRKLDLEHDPPFVISDSLTGSRLDALRDRTPVAFAETLPLGLAMAAVLAAAHRLGLAHGRLGPNTVWLTAEGHVHLDFTGIDTGDPAAPGVTSDIGASCRAPELAKGQEPDPAADVYSLGALLYWLLTGQPWSEEEQGTRRGQRNRASCSFLFAPTSLLASDPTDRPSARVVEDRLLALGQAAGVAPDFLAMDSAAGARNQLAATNHLLAPAPVRAPLADLPLLVPAGAESTGSRQLPRQLGHYQLREKLGEGGLGTVYRAEDLADGSVVAIKVLHARWDNQPLALRRFRKEARLLAEVRNPFVANLIEVNEDAGLHYLVMEYVDGRSLAAFLAERQVLHESLAVAIMADVARALVEAHQRGIVHRDIKPENILLVEAHRQGMDPGLARNEHGGQQEPSPAGVATTEPWIKLCDFGLARHVQQSESQNVTQPGGAVGTPFYAAPEQCSGGVVGPPADVYPMGAALFHLLTGRPPFVADSALALGMMHVSEPPPPLQKLNSAISDATCHIVDRALAKDPAGRYADAGAMLRDLERVLRGEPANIIVHPRLPPCEKARMFQFDWSWDLDAAPHQLWPYVSNTERLNHAVGLPAVAFTAEPDASGGVRRFGTFRKAGFTNVWREHPFEWVEGRRMGVLREYNQGVFSWLATMTELRPRPGGGTTLLHQVRIEPRGFMGRLVARMEVGVRGRRTVEKIYRRIDAFLAGRLGPTVSVDPFEQAPPPTRNQRRRLEQALSRLLTHGLEPTLVNQLGEFLLHAPAQDVARIRPLLLARRLEAEPDQVVSACLVGAREGLLVLLWDLLCPVCRIPAGIKESLKALEDHGHCEACNLDFALDFTNSVEMIFRVHPDIRGSDLGVYCIGGPVHSPHVAAQMRVHAGEQVELDLALAEGSYRVRGPQLPYVLDFQVRSNAPQSRWDLKLRRNPLPLAMPRGCLTELRAGRQLLVLINDYPQEVLVRVERTTVREDSLTATRAASLSLFRELFPSEMLSPGQLVSVAAVTLLAADLDQAYDLDRPGNVYETLGDARAFGLLHDFYGVVEEAVRREGGAVVKTEGESVLVAFPDPAAAVRAGLELPAQVSQELAAPGGECPPAVGLRLGIHRGSVLAASVNDHLNYFGATVSQAARLPQFIGPGEMVLTQVVAGDPQVAGLLRLHRLEIDVLPARLPGPGGCLLHRVHLRKNASA